MNSETPLPPLRALLSELRRGWQPLATWRLADLRAEPSQARLTFERGDGQRVIFRLSDPVDGGRRGPFDLPGLAIAYLPGALAFGELELLGVALRERLRGLQAAEVLRGLQAAAAQPKRPLVWPLTASEPEAQALITALDPQLVAGLARARWPQRLAEAAQALGFELCEQGDEPTPRVELPEEVPPAERQPVGPVAASMPAGPAPAPQDWAEQARQQLIGKPDVSLRLADFVPAAALPPWRCALPWTRLELAQGGTVGPCCVEYQATRSPAQADCQTMWNGPALQGFRRALVASAAKPGQLPATCLQTCPVWQGQTEPPGEVRLVGGPAEAVESQIRTVQALLRGDVQVDGAPLSVCLTVTSFCNYDCLMCPLGQEGTLADELTPAFYAGLMPMLRGVQVLEVNGGEPMASAHFRAFLQALDRRALPQLRVNMISNGSYLSEKQLLKLRHVPWGNLTLSLNAASAERYQLVNRGLEFARIRAHLDALAALRRSGELQAQLTYSMVLLKQNVGEIELLGEMAEADGAGVRLMLPFRNRHDSSLLTDRTAMLEALRGMQALTRRLQQRGRGREARGVLAQARVLWERLDRGIFAPL